MIKKLFTLTIIIVSVNSYTADARPLSWKYRNKKSKKAVAWTNFVVGFHNGIRGEDLLPPLDVEDKFWSRYHGYRVARAILNEGVNPKSLSTFTPWLFEEYDVSCQRPSKGFTEKCIKDAHIIMEEQLEI